MARSILTSQTLSVAFHAGQQLGLARKKQQTVKRGSGIVYTTCTVNLRQEAINLGHREASAYADFVRGWGSVVR